MVLWIERQVSPPSKRRGIADSPSSVPTHLCENPFASVRALLSLYSKIRAIVISHPNEIVNHSLFGLSQCQLSLGESKKDRPLT